MSTAAAGQAAPACGVCLAVHKPLVSIAGRPVPPLRVNGRPVEQLCRDCSRELDIKPEAKP